MCLELQKIRHLRCLPLSSGTWSFSINLFTAESPKLYFLMANLCHSFFHYKTVSKHSYLPTFQQNKQPHSNSPNYDKLHKVRTAIKCPKKKLCQIRSVTELPQTNTFVQHMSDVILKYTRRISLTSLAINFCAVRHKFTAGRKMITNSGKLRSLTWEQVGAF